MSEEENESEAEFLDDDDDGLVSYAWSKGRTVYLMMEYAAALQQATANFFAQVAEQAGADHNAKVDEDIFHQEVAKEIETLPEFKAPEA